MSDVLFKLLQTVQHGLLQQLACPGCPSNAAVAGDRPQLRHAGPKPGQVAMKLLELDREERGQKLVEQKNTGSRRENKISNLEKKSDSIFFYLFFYHKRQ